MRAPRQSGFTLIELVMVIVLTGIMATITAVFIVEPMRAYLDQTRRAGLVDDAEIALRRMGRDIRAAVPNSVRVLSAGQQVQMYNAVSGARYRTTPREEPGAAVPPDDAVAILEFDRADGNFHVLGAGFPGVSVVFTSTAHFLIIYNLGTLNSDVYLGSGPPSPVITPVGTSITIAGNQVTLVPPFQFGWESPQQRVFLSDGPVTYACGGGTLTRAGVVVTSNVTACNFTYTAGTATRSALATMSITLTREGESVTLLRQVHVENLP